MKGYEIIVFIITASAAFVLLAIFIIYFIILNRKTQKASFTEKKLLQTQFEQSILQTRIEIQEQTLKNISQEIHDNIGQVLSLAKLNLNTFSEPDTANRDKIESTKQLVSKAINDLRSLSRSMHGDMIAALGLQESIANELGILENTGQFQTSLKTEGQPYRLDPQKEMVLFRIVQEALHNAVKHSKASHITVQISYSNDAYALSVSDNGEGFDATLLNDAPKGIGLNSMKSRAALAGAEFSIRSSPGSGTVVLIDLQNPSA